MSSKSEVKIVKTRGKVYTPNNIVSHILNLSNYDIGKNILKKHVIDNSCGDGAFLVEIVERYIKAALLNNYSKENIKYDLEKYIHGIEIDIIEREKCISNVNDIIQKYDIKNVEWDIICGDALLIDKYNGKMDFVIGNPPYVRVHNLGDKLSTIKEFSFSKSGMTDLYIVFYEVGIKMLNKNGVLGYITPSSLFNSLACKKMRNYFIKEKLISKIVDFKHTQLFNATTYTTILILSNINKENKVEYYEYCEEKDKLKYIDTLGPADFYINNNFYFASKQELQHLKKILTSQFDKNVVVVKNGFATLNDEFFIGKFDFSNWVIPIIKASTGKKKECLFPYKNGVLVSYDDLTKDNEIREYFDNNKQKLIKRSLEKNANWYAFGRSQGINDVYKTKYSINSIIKDVDSIKLILCPKGVGVYSGLYILTELSEEKMKSIILNNDFISYVKILGKYKSGGYYTFSSSDLKKYIEYTLSIEDNNIE